jgi:D-serine deaminase-like pyridoxal phosphate-dependent protein
VQSASAYESYHTLFADVPKPFAFLDMDRLDANIEAVLRHSGHKQIRIASKAVRSVEILRYITEKSNRFQGVMCYTLAEARFLAEQGFIDLLVAYPTCDRKEIAQAVSWLKKGVPITLMVDSIAHIRLIADVAVAEAASYPKWADFLRVRVELDPHGVFLNDYLRTLFGLR